MENEIKELIEKWKREYLEIDINGKYKDSDEYINSFILDLKSLLKFKQENCCGNMVIEEATHKKIEITAYNKGYDDGYLNRVKGGER